MQSAGHFHDTKVKLICAADVHAVGIGNAFFVQVAFNLRIADYQAAGAFGDTDGVTDMVVMAMGD